ncbi:MAG: hypothetical protein CL912_00875 [Deltaproteobacteria bacterium]|nr:hypothetical protein [Deltaproteobacteria bacterium]
MKEESCSADLIKLWILDSVTNICASFAEVHISDMEYVGLVIEPCCGDDFICNFLRKVHTGAEESVTVSFVSKSVKLAREVCLFRWSADFAFSTRFSRRLTVSQLWWDRWLFCK